MTLSDLPQQIQDYLNNERAQLQKKWHQNDSYNVVLTNAEGTRYFTAYRKCYAHPTYGWKFGGGSYWVIRYGKILWDRKRPPMYESKDDYEYFWVRSGKCFAKAANGTEIPATLEKKADVIALAKQVGIFDI